MVREENKSRSTSISQDTDVSCSTPKMQGAGEGELLAQCWPPQTRVHIDFNFENSTKKAMQGITRDLSTIAEQN